MSGCHLVYQIDDAFIIGMVRHFGHDLFEPDDIILVNYKDRTGKETQFFNQNAIRRPKGSITMVRECLDPVDTCRATKPRYREWEVHTDVEDHHVV